MQTHLGPSRRNKPFPKTSSVINSTPVLAYPLPGFRLYCPRESSSPLCLCPLRHLSDAPLSPSPTVLRRCSVPCGPQRPRWSRPPHSFILPGGGLGGLRHPGTTVDLYLSSGGLVTLLGKDNELRYVRHHPVGSRDYAEHTRSTARRATDSVLSTNKVSLTLFMDDSPLPPAYTDSTSRGPRTDRSVPVRPCHLRAGHKGGTKAGGVPPKHGTRRVS